MPALAEPGGNYVATDRALRQLPPGTRDQASRRQEGAVPESRSYRSEDVDFLNELIEPGKYRPVIDRTYPFEDVVEANRYVETGQKTGNVVLRVVPSDAESRDES